jgi:adenosylhomocysteine nucleosidase
MILLVFALPHESGKFLPQLKNRVWIERGTLPILTGTFAGREIVVLHTGVGPERARKRCGDFLAAHRPDFVISAGYAGGLDERLQVGSLVIADNFTDQSFMTLAMEAARGKALIGKLTTQDRVAETTEAKRQLAGTTGAVAVDMETEAIYLQCRLSNIPMLSVRAISDPIGTAMPVPGEVWLDEIEQKPRVLALLAYLARNPSVIPAFARFVRGTNLARNEFTGFLCAFLRRAP